jgi:subtilase family serine protease
MHAIRHSPDAVTALSGRVTPADILAAYDVPGNVNGAGQTIAIIMGANPLSSDLSTYWQSVGASETLASYTSINVLGGPNPTSQLTDAQEASIDVEWSGGVAPGAQLRLYAIPSLTTASLMAACSQIISDGLASVVSYSAGAPEDAYSPGGLNSVSQTLAQMAAAGVTVIVSSGDSGSNPTTSGINAYDPTKPLSPSYPASDPNATGAGGTTVTFDYNWFLAGETTWSQIGTVLTDPLASGGGVSATFPRPSWQAGPGVPSGAMRCVPDVAALASAVPQAGGYTGASFVFTGQVSGAVGTSISSQIWAGLVAVMNQARSNAGLPNLGLLGPWIYPLVGSDAFNDITTGNNGAYNAAIGYDLCTGAGTPNVAKLIALIDEEITSVPPPANPVNIGASVSMSATAQLPATYQWALSGVSIPGATASTYSIPSVGSASAGAYTVAITSSLGTFTYAIGNLLVFAAPAISAQPASIAVFPGQTPIFAVGATGTPAPMYQWQKNGTNISGATGSGYAIASAQPSDAGAYSVVVFNSQGTVTSNTASLTFNGPPSITTQPASLTVSAGASSTLTAVAPGATTYQWRLNGANIAGATSSSLTLSNFATTQAGTYTVVVSNVYGPVTSNPVALTASVVSHLYNISSRAYIGPGLYQNLVAGFYTDGSGSKNVVVRGIGPNLAIVAPSLAAMVLPNPKLTVYNGSAAVLATNTAWGGGQTLANAFASVYASALQPNSNDTAAFLSVPAGPGIGYTTQIDGLNDGSGVALVEVYDYDSYVGTPASRLINISSRAVVGMGNQSLVAGFYVIGSTSQTLLIRAVGPGLAGTPAYSGLTLARPTLTLFDSSGNTIATNIGWGNAITPGNSTVAAGIQPATAAVMNSVYASTIAAGSKDCAMVVTLPTGGSAAGYTAQVSSADSTTGLALVEVYNVP